MATIPETEQFAAKLALLGQMREQAMHSSPEAEAKQHERGTKQHERGKYTARERIEKLCLPHRGSDGVDIWRNQEV